MTDATASDAGLVVPIDVDALCVRQDVSNNQYFLKPFAEFEDLASGGESDNPMTSQTARVGPDPSVPGSKKGSSMRRYDPGVYLHWALPDALTHGTVHEEHGTTELPPVPNRWLVVRTILGSGSPSPSVDRQAWIVVSDYVATEPPGGPTRKKRPDVDQPTSTVPLAVEKSKSPYSIGHPFGYLGRAVPFEKWEQRNASVQSEESDDFQEGTYPEALTVMGYGEPAWAALYPNSSAAFGLHEPAGSLPSSFDPDEQELQYTVVGWYDDPTHDPVHDATAESVLSAHDWALASGKQGMPDHFSYSLYHGTVQNIPWASSACDPQVPGTDDLSVSLGNNAAEALSTLAAHEGAKASSATSGTAASPEKIRHLEFWLNALQLGLLGKKDLGAIEDREAIRQQIHARAFTVSGAGVQWTVRPKSSSDGSGEKVGEALQHMTTAQIQLLRELNDVQRTYNRRAAKLRTERFQVFADWWRYMEAKVKGKPSRSPKGSVLRKLHDRLEGLTGDGQGDYTEFLQSDRVEALRPVYLDGTSHEVNPGNQLEPAITEKTGTKQKKLDHLEAKIAKKKKALEAKLKQNPPSKTLSLELRKTSADGYARPSDPVVLLKGEVAQPTDRHGQDGRHRDDGRLRCRSTSNLANGFVYHGATSIKVSRTEMPASPSGKPLPNRKADAIDDLVREALVLDPWAALRYAPQAPADEKTACRKALKTAATKGTVPSELTIPGHIPSPLASTDWSPPWNPIMLEWKINVHPFEPIKTPSDGYPSDTITSNFEVEDVDLNVQKNREKSPSAEDYTYEGRVVLAAGARTTLKDKIEKIPHLKDHKKLKKKLDRLTDAPILSQSLGGFHDWQIQKHQVFQLNPLPVDLSLFEEVNAVREAVGTRTPDVDSNKVKVDAIPAENTHAPAPNEWYNPIRAATAGLTDLRVVDTFGQVRRIKVADHSDAVHRANALQIPEVLQGDLPPSEGKQVFLSPRLCQPSRLNFNWISPQGKRAAESDPTASPICGWVVPIYLTDGLMVFARSGEPLGTLYAVGDGNGTNVVWEDAPLRGDAATGVGKQAAKKHATSVLDGAGANEALRGFVIGTIENGASYLKSVVDLTWTAHSTVDPGGHQDAPIESLVMGQPLALTRARLSMELQGLRALNQSYEALLDHLKNSYESGGAQPYAERTSNNFEHVRFPVKLGSKAKHYDGLIGYFADGDYRHFHTLFVDDVSSAHKHVRPATGSGALELTPTSATDGADGSGPTHPRDVTLLMDPRAQVHATTGIQPVKSRELSTSHYRPILRKLKVSVLTSPVLTGPPPTGAGAAKPEQGNFGLPLPGTKEGTWSWVEKAPPSSPEDVDWAQVSQENIHEVSADHHRSYPHLSVREGWLLYDRGSSNAPSSNGEGASQA